MLTNEVNPNGECSMTNLRLLHQKSTQVRSIGTLTEPAFFQKQAHAEDQSSNFFTKRAEL